MSIAAEAGGFMGPSRKLIDSPDRRKEYQNISYIPGLL
jgi:hypothetical protein